MTWFKVDDGWWSNPDTLELSLAACGLWSKAGSYCGHRKSPFVSKQAVRMLGGTPKLASELVAVGYWDVVEGGWQFHNWEEYQPDDAERDKWRERKRRQREASRDSHGTVTGQSRGVTQMSGIPSRPDPVPETDITHLDLNSTKGDGDEIESDEEFIAQEATKVGIRDLRRIRRAVEAIMPADAAPPSDALLIDITRAIVMDASEMPRSVEAYVEAACRRTPENVLQTF